MKNKIKGTKFWVIFYLVMAIINYSLLCYDLERDKDLLTYGWLLYTIILFCMFIVYGVKLEILRNNDNKTSHKTPLQ